MLSSINVSNIFNLYSYSLDLKAQESRICFITGPNGYGKTSILNIVNDVYSGDWENLCKIPFDSVSLAFSDGARLKIVQSRKIAQEDESDENDTENVALKVDFQLTPDDLYSFEWISCPDSDISPDNNIKLFFDSHPVYYIRDGRLYSAGHIPTIYRCVENMRSFLKDSSLAETQDFQKKVEIFKKIISTSDFADKFLQIDSRYGFRFVLDNDDKTILSPEKLSSGEQHLTVMAFELLFMAPDDSLVLIDEPEISFHMMWQVDFLKNLQLILSVRKLQCIVATHSPQIFNMKWGLSVDLFTQAGIK